MGTHVLYTLDSPSKVRMVSLGAELQRSASAAKIYAAASTYGLCANK